MVREEQGRQPQAVAMNTLFQTMNASVVDDDEYFCTAVSSVGCFEDSANVSVRGM